MSPVLFWAGLPKWAQDAIKIAGAILAVIFLGKAYVMVKQNEAVQKDRAKQRARAAEAEAEIITTITENSNELVENAERVRARDAVRKLPDGTEGLPKYNYRD